MLNVKLAKFAIILSSIILGGALTSTCMAAESGALNYPAGSPGPLVGEFPPIQGLFMVSQTSYTTSTALYDSHGDKIDADDFSMDAWAETFRILASYPRQLWGARLYSQLVIPIVHVDSSLSVSTPFGSIDIFDDSDAGLGNITVSPLIMNWYFPESHQYFTVGLDIALEAGASYSANSPVNAGTGYNTIMPVLAYRYDNPNGFDIGARLTPMFNLENDNTDYDTGDMVAVDFTTGWNIGKWKVGIVGGYTKQFENDQKNGVDIPNSKMESLLVGPSIMYSVGPIIINLNYQKGVLAENTSKNDSFWLNFTIPLYVPESARPKK